MRNFKYLLWRQGESPTTDDTILIDGEKAHGVEGQEAFNFMSIGLKLVIDGKQHIWTEKNIKDKIKKFQSETGETTSPSLSVYTDNFRPRHLLIKSHYNNVDNVGRRIVFLFCTPITSSLSDVVELLKEASMKTNMECNVADLHFIEQKLTIKKNINKLVVVTVLIIAILLCIIIWIIKNYN